MQAIRDIILKKERARIKKKKDKQTISRERGRNTEGGKQVIYSKAHNTPKTLTIPGTDK